VQADIQIQGGTFDQVLVLIDGVRLTDPQTGHHMLNLMVPPEAIERIEIIKGAAARRYGMNALSGVVNIVTLKTANPGVYATGYTGSGFNKDTTTQNTYNNKGLRFSHLPQQRETELNPHKRNGCATLFLGGHHPQRLWCQWILRRAGR
jgi:iron complex outermembrane receptor protein